jgi:hypothetical protein
VLFRLLKNRWKSAKSHAHFSRAHLRPFAEHVRKGTGTTRVVCTVVVLPWDTVWATIALHKVDSSTNTSRVQLWIVFYQIALAQSAPALN